jgi:DNA processing protein
MRMRKLVGRFGSAEAVLRADVEDLCRVDGVDQKTAQNIRDGVDRAFAEEQIRRAGERGVHVLTYWENDYPGILKTIPDPPAVLFVRGELDGRDRIAVAIVGTRTPSTYGRTTAERFGEGMAGLGITVVSGLARGVDTAAHRGALRAAGRTVAVLGCGVDVVYPPENATLFEEIAQRGALISEFPMGTEPDPGFFPRRNRIISGLSKGTLVVEAGDRSGALITAYMALEQNREVFAVPGPITSSKSKGTNRLIREGAKLVDCVEDVLVEIPEAGLTSGRTPIVRSVPEELSDPERRLYGFLGDQPKHIDQLALEGNLTTSEALSLLLSMELKNRVRQIPGMQFVRIPA